jgi:hypothetical protein
LLLAMLAERRTCVATRVLDPVDRPEAVRKLGDLRDIAPEHGLTEASKMGAGDAGR